MAKILFVVFAVLLLSCESEDVQSLRSGIWGGEHIRLQAEPTYWFADMDCAHLEVNQPVVFRNGRYESTAAYYQEYGIQVEDEELLKPKAAVISGQRNGNELTLKLRVENQEIDSYKLYWNQEAMVYKCP